MDARNCGKLIDVMKHAAICFLLDHTRECCAFLCHAPLPTHHVIYAGAFKIQRLGFQPSPDMLRVPLPHIFYGIYLPHRSPGLERGSQVVTQISIHASLLPKQHVPTLRLVCYATDSENELASRGIEEFGEGDSAPC